MLGRLGKGDPSRPLALTGAIATQFALMNVTVAGPTVQTEDEVIEVWSDNWDTLRAWVAVATQWRSVKVAGFEWMGLDYSAVDVALRRLGLDHIPFEDLQIMEAAALDTLAEVMT